MDSQPAWRPELSPADLDAHYARNGPIALALEWVEMVLEGRLGDAWPSTTSSFRLALTRHWCWQHRAALHGNGHDPLLVAAALADEGPAHPLWPAFARSQRSPESA